jgi:hypothetical protein
MIEKVMREELMVLGDRIAENAAHIDAAMYRLLSDIRTFDDERGWFHEGAQSCAHWLSWRVGWDLATARERVRVARRLGELPQIAQALEKAEVSYSKVRAMTRVATNDNEEVLLGYARAVPAAQLETICRKFQMVQRLARTDPDLEAAQRRVSRRVRDDGMVLIEAVLRPDEAALLWAALDRATDDVSAGERNRVDGLLALARDYACSDVRDATPVEVVVTISQEGLTGDTTDVGTIHDGTALSAEASRRLACDAGIVEMIERPTGEILSVRPRTRSIPSAIKRALRRRDDTCRFPGCTNRRFIEGHHLQHWADGGETTLKNLVILCTHHHVFVHEHGYRIELDADQQPTFYDPRGRVVDVACQRSQPAGAAWHALLTQNRHLAITPTTGQCAWDGMPADYHAAIDGLLSVESQPQLS